MAEIALRTYIEQLDNLIERKQVDEVVAHCRHILSLYPKHLDTYRMLGKALLEKGRHGDAADIFQRVLSVVPDDFIAHVGMSIVREDEANLDAAIWHMERAFETSPSNGAIQQELCRLYGRRDGVVPAKARLTRGALARMYSQGGLYPQAEAELKAALAEQPDRIDLMTVLARVYSQTEQPAEAAQACAEILQKLPYSLEANRILLAIFHQQGRAADASVYRHRLEALDPYEAFVDPTANGSASRRIEPDKVAIERLDYVPGMEDSGSPDWLNSIGVRFEETMARPTAEAAPDWLTSAAEAPQPASAVPEPGAADLPDWLRELQAAPSAEPVAAPDWLNQLDTIQHAPAAEGPEAEVPEWMRPALPESSADATMPSLRASAAQPGEADTDLPDWLAAAAAGAAIVSGARPETPAQPAEPAPDTGTPVSAVDDSSAELPDWLKSAASGEVAEETSDWLQTLSAPQPMEAAAETLAAAEEPAAPADEQLPDWLRTAVAASPGDSQLPDWMKAEVSADQPAPTPAAPAEPEQPLAIPDLDAETREWLAASRSAAAEAEPGLASPELAPEAPVAPGPVVPEPAGDLPAWLQPGEDQPASGTLSEAEAVGAPEPAPIPEMPDWLHAVAASAPTPDHDTPEWPPEPSAALTQVPDTERPPVELPDFLQPASPEAIARAEQPFVFDADEPETAEAQEPDIALPAEIPDWLRALAPISPDPLAAEPAEPAEPTAPPLDQPDWLSSLAPAAAESEAAAPAEAIIPEGALPEGLTAAPPAPIEITPTDLPPWAEPREPGPTDTITSWLAGRPAASPTPAEAQAEDLAAASPDELQPEAMTPPAEPASPESAVTPADLPPWAEPREPGPTDTITSWLASRPAPAEEDAAEAPIEAAPSELDGDEALRWLEKLAAQQGANPDELLTTPEERAEASPTWLAAPPADQAASPGAAPSPTEPALPAWLEADQQPTPTGPTAEAAPAGGAPAEPEPEMPAWLRSAGEPEIEPETPAWLAGALAGAGVAAAAAAVTEPEDVGPAEPYDQKREPAEPPSMEAWLSQAEQALPIEALADTAPRKPPAGPDIGAETLAAAVVPEAAVEEQSAGEALPPETPASAAADLEADEALRWLEGLAAQQGANPDELLTTPEERPAAPPGWIAALQTQPAEPAAEQPALEASQPEPGEPASLVELAASVPAEPAGFETVAAETPLPAESAAVLDEDEAMRWLEGLAAKQGASPDELLTTPAERLSETPSWIAAEQAASAQAEDLAIEPEPLAEPEPAAGVAPPDWLRPSEVGPIEPEAGPIGLDQAPSAAPEPEPDVDKLSRLADRLAAARRTKEMEIEARFAEQRAQQEEARRQVQERMASWRQAIEADAEPAPEPSAAQPLQPPPAARAEAPPPAPPQSDYLTEVERLSSQVEAGEELDQAVRQLENLAAGQQAPAPVLRLLGDVYLKRNQLPEALEAYRSALARL